MGSVTIPRIRLCGVTLYQFVLATKAVPSPPPHVFALSGASVLHALGQYNYWTILSFVLKCPITLEFYKFMCEIFPSWKILYERFYSTAHMLYLIIIFVVVVFFFSFFFFFCA